MKFNLILHSIQHLLNTIDIKKSVELVIIVTGVIMKIFKKFISCFSLHYSQMSYAGSFIDSASVVSVDKVYKQVRVEEPYQECYIKETVQNNGDGSATNEIIGGVIGGAIGNKLGKGDGNDIMTLAGILWVLLLQMMLKKLQEMETNYS